MTSKATSAPRPPTALAIFAAVAFFGAASVAQAQSTTSSPSATTRDSSAPTGSASGSPTQVNPDSRDSNRQASQGMVPAQQSAQGDSARARINAPGSDLRNDRTTMARAPRADRN